MTTIQERWSPHTRRPKPQTRNQTSYEKQHGRGCAHGRREPPLDGEGDEHGRQNDAPKLILSTRSDAKKPHNQNHRGRDAVVHGKRQATVVRQPPGGCEKEVIAVGIKEPLFVSTALTKPRFQHDFLPGKAPSEKTPTTRLYAVKP